MLEIYPRAVYGDAVAKADAVIDISPKGSAIDEQLAEGSVAQNRPMASAMI